MQPRMRVSIPVWRRGSRYSRATVSMTVSPDEQGAGLGYDLHRRVKITDALLVCAAADGGGGGNEAHPTGLGHLHRPAAGRLHHAQDGQVIFPAQNGQAGGGHSAAGHQNGLDVEAAEKMHILPGIFQQDLRGAAPVGHTGSIAEVYNVFRGQEFSQLPDGGQSAYAGVEYAHRPLIHSDSPRMIIVTNQLYYGSAGISRKIWRDCPFFSVVIFREFCYTETRKGRSEARRCLKMELKLTQKQFRRLLDLVYIGNWVLNSTRGDDRIRDYDQVESLVFSHCLGRGMEKLTELYEGELIPSRAFAEGGIHEAIMAYEDNVFFEILAQELALRDLDDPPITEENYDEVMERMNAYLGEFQRHGTDHVTVELEE